ncbi:hypothetical protein VPH35_036888 [Triticum aestivum]
MGGRSGLLDLVMAGAAVATVLEVGGVEAEEAVTELTKAFPWISAGSTGDLEPRRICGGYNKHWRDYTEKLALATCEAVREGGNFYINTFGLNFPGSNSHKLYGPLLLKLYGPSITSQASHRAHMFILLHTFAYLE